MSGIPGMLHELRHSRIMRREGQRAAGWESIWRKRTVVFISVVPYIAAAGQL